MALTKVLVNEENVPREKSSISHELKADFQLLEKLSESVTCSRTEELLSSSRFNLELGSDDIDKDELFEINRLLQALRYFDLKPSATQLRDLRDKFSVNSSKLVRFGDFVEAVKDVFNEELIDKSLISGASAFDLKYCIHNSSERKQNLELENSALKDEIRILKKQLKSMEIACSHTEDDLFATRKDLQNCIDRIRQLLGEQKIEVGYQIAGAGDCEQAIAKESNPNYYKESIHLRAENKRLHASNLVFRTTSYKLLHFMEDLLSSLVGLIHAPRNKVCRSFSLYRNIACGSTLQCSTSHSHGSVARAASVCTPVKGDSFQGQMKNIQYDALVDMTTKMQEILTVSKQIMKDECHGTKSKGMPNHTSNPINFSTGPPSRNLLFDLPPKTTVTIMSRV